MNGVRRAGAIIVKAHHERWSEANAKHCQWQISASERCCEIRASIVKNPSLTKPLGNWSICVFVWFSSHFSFTNRHYLSFRVCFSRDLSCCYFILNILSLALSQSKNTIRFTVRKISFYHQSSQFWGRDNEKPLDSEIFVFILEETLTSFLFICY